MYVYSRRFLKTLLDYTCLTCSRPGQAQAQLIPRELLKLDPRPATRSSSCWILCVWSKINHPFGVRLPLTKVIGSALTTCSITLFFNP